MRLFFYFILIIHFYTPNYALFHESSALYIIFPYLKDYIVMGMVLLYFIYIKFMGGSIFLKYRKDRLFLLLILFLVYILISYTYVTLKFSSFIHIDNFPLSSLFFAVFIFAIYYHKLNLGQIFVEFITITKLFQVLLFVELLSTFFINNPYSFSSYNGAFVSAFILDLNTVAITTNLAFGFALYSIFTSKTNRAFNYFVLIASFIVCYFTYNRTALLLDLILLGFVVYSIYGFNRSVKNIIAVFMFFFFLNTFTSFLQTANVNKQDLTDSYTLYLRLLLAYIGIRVLLTSWFFGTGPFLINDEMWSKIKSLNNDPFFEQITYITNNTTLESGIWITHPHIAYLNMWLSFGLLGLLFYFYVFRYLRAAYKERRKNIAILAPIIGLFIILVHNFFYPQLHISHIVFFIVVIKFYYIQIMQAKKAQRLLSNQYKFKRSSI